MMVKIVLWSMYRGRVKGSEERRVCVVLREKEKEKKKKKVRERTK